MSTVEAVALPDHLHADQLRNKIAVVIDVLRATTTIVEAIGNGASCVVPVQSVDGARILAQDRDDALLCGERGGIRPEGFALGNSPCEYSNDTILNKACVLTTTNGTRALHMSEGAQDIVIGSITNVDALCDWISADGRDVVLVCSGTDQRASLEDCIGAGLVVDRLGYKADDSALMMLHTMKGCVDHFGGIRYAVESSFHAKRLIEMGFEHDVEFASRLSTNQVVPVFDAYTTEIHTVK
jgi:2-phosphosulfolactate phosphatase